MKTHHRRLTPVVRFPFICYQAGATGVAGVITCGEVSSSRL
jgi:hypothetical protein